MKQSKLETANNKFVINHFSPTETYQIFPIVGEYFATPVSIIFGAQASGSEEAMSDAIPTAVQYMFKHMKDSGFIPFIQLLTQKTYASGDRKVSDHIDEIFEEDPSEVITLITKIVEVNFGPFLKADFGGLIQSVFPVAQAKEELYPQKSEGQSA